MRLVHSETERTTAATDAALGLLCGFLAIQLALAPVQAPFKRGIWVAALLLLSLGSLLGAIVHGIDVSASWRALLWKPLYLSLGLAVSLVAVGATFDGWGESTARWLLPWALGAGVLFFAVTQWLSGAFVVFLLYEAGAILLALGIYVSLALRESPGAAATAGGVALSLIAAVVQATSLSLRLGVRFDHNGLFHLIQIAGVALIAYGLKASL